MRLYRNILWMVISRYGSQALMVLSNLLLARYLGSAGFGEYAFMTAIVMMGNAFSTFGTDMALIRSISSTQDYSDLLPALFLQLFISIVFIIIGLSVSLFLPVPRALQIYIFALIPLSFFTIFTSALRGAQMMGSFSFLHFVLVLMQMIAVFLLAGLNGSVEQLAFYLLYAQIIAAAAGFVLCYIRINDFFEKWTFSWRRLPALIRSSGRLALIGTLRLVYEKIAITILPTLASISMTGFFASSSRVIDAAKLGHMSALTALYPEMAQTKVAGTQLEKSKMMLFVAALVISIFLYIFAEPLILLLFGIEFKQSILALRVLAWSIVPYYFVSYYSLAFVALEKEQPVLRALTVALLILVILLFSLTPLYGLRGAATAVLTAELIQALLLWMQWRKYKYALSKLS